MSSDIETQPAPRPSGLNVPAAVKFNSRGELHILDTAAGSVVKRNADGSTSVVANLAEGLDNLAFDENDNLYVSSYTDGSILKVVDGSFEEILPAGIAHPGGLAIYGDSLAIADLQSVRSINTITQSEDWVIRNIFRVAPIGTTTSIAPVGGNLLLTSWLDNSVKILDPITRELVHSIENLNVPVSSAAFNGFYAVALHGNSSVSLFRADGSLHKVLSSDFDAPTHVIPYEEGLLVSDRERGQLIKLFETGETQVVVDGLTAPEGIALFNETIFVFEGDTGEIKEVINNTTPKILRTVIKNRHPILMKGEFANAVVGYETIGFEELLSPDEVESALSKTGTALVVVNSVCGCAAANARPAVRISLNNQNTPDYLYTVFAGVDHDATDAARAKMIPFPPSSPSLALFKDLT